MTVLRRMVGGVGAAWLAALLLIALLAISNGEFSAESVGALGWLPGLAFAVVAPVVAALAAAARRVPGAVLVVCAVSGAVVGLVLTRLLGGLGDDTSVGVQVQGAGVGLLLGVAGWAGSRLAARSTIAAVVLPVTAGALWGTSMLLLLAAA